MVREVNKSGPLLAFGRVLILRHIPMIRKPVATCRRLTFFFSSNFIKGNDAANEWAREGAETPLRGAESLCRIGNEFVTKSFKNEKERLNEIY